jgi:hypothetical protein
LVVWRAVSAFGFGAHLFAFCLGARDERCRCQAAGQDHAGERGSRYVEELPVAALGFALAERVEAHTQQAGDQLELCAILAVLALARVRGDGLGPRFAQDCRLDLSESAMPAENTPGRLARECRRHWAHRRQ